MKILFLFITMLFMSGLMVAQNPTYYLNPDKKLTQYNFDRWTTANGLPSNSLLYLTQSSEGYMWISGYSGLIRYDGSKFKVFNNTNTDVFNSNVIRNISEDSAGRLWMNTQGNGLISYDKGVFKSFGKDQNMLHLYRGLLVDHQDRIWGASPEHGWFYLEDDQFNFIEYSSSLKNIEVRSIVQSKSGAIWFATLGEGIFKYENGILKRYSKENGLSDDWVYSLYFDSEDNLWIGTSKGMCLFDGYRFTNVIPEISSTVSKILKDRFGNLWVGTFEGLYRKKVYTNELEYVTSDNGLSNNFIIDFVFDKEGSLWITHYKGGLTRVKDGKFTNYTIKGGLPGKVVNTVIEANDSTLLVGFDNGSLIKIIDGEIDDYPLKHNLEGNRIRHIMISKRGYLWLSTYFGLLTVSPEGVERWYNESDGFFGTKMRLTFQDSRDNIWVGTRNNGVIRISPQQEIDVFNVENGLSSNLIMSIEEDLQGNIWIGTSEGDGALNKINLEDNVTSFTDKTKFNSDIVFNIFCDNEGVVWFATVDGLWFYKEFAFFNVTIKQGLVDNSVYDVVEDGLGFLWMPYSNGVMKVKKDDVINFSKNSDNTFLCRVFDKFDGMPNSECNPTAQVLKGSNGTLYFPTLDGLSFIDPKDEIINNYIPPVLVENVVVDKKEFSVFDVKIFEPGNIRYTFNFTALSLYEPEKVNFKYQLLGFDDDWNETTERSVSYTNLKHGEYTFKVKASNNDNVWNETGAQYVFNIKPKFIETIFFYILILVFSFSAVFLIYVWRISQLKNQQEVLESTIKQRTSEIIDKNNKLENQKSEIQNQNQILLKQKDEIQNQTAELEKQKDELKVSNSSKDKIFSIISHDLRSPLGNIKNMLNLLVDKTSQFDNEKRERILGSLAEITKSTFYLLDNLLNWSRSQRGLITYDPQMFMVAPVFNEILSLVRHQSEIKNITLELAINESDLAFGDVNMVTTIFRNIIENAIKFTRKGGKIEISSSIKNEKIEFAFKDDGVGMTEEMVFNIVNNREINATFGTNREKGSGLGLLLCKDFIAKNGGTLKIESKVDRGSTFYITLKGYQL